MAILRRQSVRVPCIQIEKIGCFRYPPKHSKGNKNRLNLIPNSEAKKFEPLQCQTMRVL